MTPRKLKNLQNSIHTAAFLVACPCPLGVNRDAWAEATNALYKANEQIDRIVKVIYKSKQDEIIEKKYFIKEPGKKLSNPHGNMWKENNHENI